MFFIRHYVIFSSDASKMKEYLSAHFGISCSFFPHSEMAIADKIIFDIPETHPQLCEIEQSIASMAPPNRQQSRSQNSSGTDNSNGYIFINYFPVYSESELLNAKWLSVRCVYYKVTPTNWCDCEELTCCCGNTDYGAPIGKHYLQKAFYTVKRPVKWGKNFFASGARSEYNLFCNDIARRYLLNNHLNGVSCDPVLQKSNGQHFPDLFQLNSSHQVPDAAFCPISDIKEHKCLQCGMKMMQFQNSRAQYALSGDCLDNTIDFYKTPPLFLGPALLTGGQHRFLVSQRFYRVLKDNLLDRNLVFTPLRVI